LFQSWSRTQYPVLPQQAFDRNPPSHSKFPLLTPYVLDRFALLSSPTPMVLAPTFQSLFEFLVT
jgi:hypothetical protein